MKYILSLSFLCHLKVPGQIEESFGRYTTRTVGEGIAWVLRLLHWNKERNEEEEEVSRGTGSRIAFFHVSSAYISLTP